MLLLLSLAVIAAWYAKIARIAQDKPAAVEASAAAAATWNRRCRTALAWAAAVALLCWVVVVRERAALEAMDQAASLCSQISDPGPCLIEATRDRLSAARTLASAELLLWLVLIL
jgi:CHASE3 domain sensor protein